MNLFRRLLVLLGGLPGSSWLGRQVFTWLDGVLRSTPLAPSRLAAMPLCFLTTVGHRSGQPHSVPLWQIPVENGTDTVVVASNFGSSDHPAWAYNLDANPGATLECNGATHAVRARRLTTEEFDRYWPRFVEVWPHYERYRNHTERKMRMYQLMKQGRRRDVTPYTPTP